MSHCDPVGGVTFFGRTFRWTLAFATLLLFASSTHIHRWQIRLFSLQWSALLNHQRQCSCNIYCRPILLRTVVDDERSVQPQFSAVVMRGQCIARVLRIFFPTLCI